MQLTNLTGISLPLALWLANDTYDFIPGDKSISATSLMKPTRQIILGSRLTAKTRQTPDISDFVASRLGHSIHDGIEQTWKYAYKKSLAKLGYPQSIIDRIRINPTPEELTEDALPVWVEQRGERTIKGYLISGKFDLVLGGVLQDFKSTSVYSWIMGNKDEDYKMQGSIYKWLHPKKITEDHMNIQFIFTDWSQAQARQQPDTYPQQRVKEHRVELLSIEETDNWIIQKLRNIEKAKLLDEADITHCTDKELWRSDPVFKYYGNPEKLEGRSTRNFKTLDEANALCAKKGKGIVITVPGKVKACLYCAAFDACTQKDSYDFN